MGPNSPFFLNNKYNIVIRVVTTVVSLLLFTVLVSCGGLGDFTKPASVNNSAAKVFASDQQRLLDDINSVDSAVEIKAVSGQVNPSARLRPLFTGSSRVEMKVLIISANGNATERDGADPTLDAITQFTENIGIPYDVMIASQEELTEAKLIAANGDGRYQAIFLTDSGLGVNSVNTAGASSSAFDSSEWNLLWQYQREFNVRQVSLNGVPGIFPEDLGLRLFDSISTTRTLAQNISITNTGEPILSSLKPSSIIPVKDVVMNLTNFCGEEDNISCPTGVTTTPILRTVTENKVIGAVSTTSDGREVLSLMMGQNKGSNHSALLSYDLLKWATQGVFLGAREMYLQVDIDDWFQQSLVWDTTTNANSNDTFRISGQDAITAKAQLESLKTRFPVAADLNYVNAIVGSKGDSTAPLSCADDSSLSAATLCVKDDFDWVSHTYTERALNFESPGYNNAADPFYDPTDSLVNGPVNGFTCDDTALTGYNPASIAEELTIKEVICNISKLQDMGIAIDPKSVITSAHSALGHYNPDPTNPVFIDNGLENSSTGSLNGMKAAGIRYMASNYSVLSHRGICEVCGRNHPNFPELFLVPRFPTLMFFNATNPAIIESQYNFLFGANGPNAPANATNLNYQQILKLDAENTLQHVASSQPYMHFFHQANLDNYDNGSPGKSLVHDWVESFLTYYTSFYDLPLITLSWEEQAANIEQKTSYFLSETTGVWDRATGQVVITSGNGGTVYVSNAAFPEATTSTYGTDTIQKFQLTAGQSVSGSTANLPTPNPVTVPLPTPQPIASNLLTNGSFENRGAAWSICGFGQLKLVNDATDGNSALKLKGRRGACLYQEVEIVAGTNYVLTCDVKRNNDARWSSLSLNFNDNDYSGEIEGELVEIIGSEYSQLRLEATAPSNTDIANIVLYSEDEAIVDNCALAGQAANPIPLPSPTPNLITNGGFEDNLRGWTICKGSDDDDAQITSDAANGSKALKLDDKTCIYQEFDVEPGQNLEFSCVAKRSIEDKYTSMLLEVYDSDYSNILADKEIEIETRDYEKATIRLSTPTGAATASISLFSEDGAKFDDCVLIRR